MMKMKLMIHDQNLIGKQMTENSRRCNELLTSCVLENGCPSYYLSKENEAEYKHLQQKNDVLCKELRNAIVDKFKKDNVKMGTRTF